MHTFTSQTLFFVIAGFLVAALPAAAQQPDGIVIKQIYYAGSDGKTAAGIRDQFIELYNNSGETVYADGLCLAALAGSRHFSSDGLEERGKRYVEQFAYQPNGMYDWQQSFGMPDSVRANTGYVYASYIYQVPGNGRDYPVAPGKSLLIAQSARNYQKPYTDHNGTHLEPTQPQLTVDLSRADLEANHCVLYENPSQARDQDNPDVPDLFIVKRANLIDLIMDKYGKEAIVIFRYPGNMDNLPAYQAPLKGGVKSTNAVHLAYPYFQIPEKYIIDAVELQPSDGVRSPKRLPVHHDAGYASNTGGEYASTSVIRKTSHVKNGRIILKDTNNSSEDFVSIPAKPDAFQ